jgi:protein-S-isoprenylcysteine O-methyltransferase Ste14
MTTPVAPEARPAGWFRALLAFVALPGLVAYALPLAWGSLTEPPPAWWPGRLQWAGLAFVAVGSAGLIDCARDFLVLGRGTLAPWDPPRQLVRTGLYLFTRNPMYVSVLLVLLGWAMAFASRGIAIYGGWVAVAFHLRVVLGEEPWLARTHGDAWREYAARVPRWLW